MSIHIQKYGKGFPIVFFHGWGFNSQVWLPLVSHLALNYQLILVDLPGAGFTHKMDWDVFKEILLKQLPQEFAVVGWSMGGLYAMRLGLEEPMRTKYLVNVTSSPKFLLDELWSGISVNVFAKFYQQLVQDPHNTLKEFIELNKVQLLEHAERFIPNQWCTQGLQFGLNILETWDLREKLHQFTNPCCFMFGRLDPIVPINTMNVMQQNYPNFHYLLFKHAAHMPFYSHQDLFITELCGFIQ